VVGLPALAALTLHALTDNTKIEGIGTVVAVAAAIALRFFRKLSFFPKMLERYSFLMTLSWLLTGALAIFLVLVVAPNRAEKKNNLLAESWLEWQKDLEKSAGQCEESDAQCLAEKLTPVLDRRPRPKHDNDVPGLASDLLAGQLMLANDNSRAILNNLLSIDQRFIGSGFSEPVGQRNITAARVPEYLVPNLSDKSPYVWFWELERGRLVDQKPIMDHKLLDILFKFPPINHADFEENWVWMSEHLGQNDTHPVLVRFALLDLKKDKYSGCLGRPAATRVFMTSLGEVESRTVTEAAEGSGYTVPEKDDAPGLRLLVWVYAPRDAGQAVAATWGNVLANFGKWATTGACVNQQ